MWREWGNPGRRDIAAVYLVICADQRRYAGSAGAPPGTRSTPTICPSLRTSPTSSRTESTTCVVDSTGLSGLSTSMYAMSAAHSASSLDKLLRPALAGACDVRVGGARRHAKRGDHRLHDLGPRLAVSDTLLKASTRPGRRRRGRSAVGPSPSSGRRSTWRRRALCSRASSPPSSVGGRVTQDSLRGSRPKTRSST